MRDPQSQSILTDAECRSIVAKFLEGESSSRDEEEHLVDYSLEPLAATSGFMGQYFKLRARLEGPSGLGRMIDFFAKLPPLEHSPMHDFNREMGSFRKEVAFYTSLLPRLPSCRHSSLPECFLGLGDELIVLEDMAQQGYRMTDKRVPFDYEHCAVVMRAIGRFHARSMIYEELANENIGQRFAYCLHETLWPLTGERGTSMFRAAVKGSISLVDMMSDLSEDERKRLKEKIASMSREHRSKLQSSATFKNVICHGDLWANNILFKHAEDGRPLACCLIDFQLARYNPPAHDIVCFLQFSTSRALRDARLADLLRVYHATVTSALSEAGLDAARIFPWAELERSVAELKPVYMLHGVLNIPIMLLDETTVNEYFVREPSRLEQVIYDDRTPLVCAQYAEIAVYRERMRDALLELHERV